jgi:hypothetical protein
MNEWADIFQTVSTELKSFLLTRFARSLQIFGTIWIRNVARNVQMAETLTTTINAILLAFRFTWRSPKFVYCAMSIFGSSVMTIFNILRIVSTEVNSTKMSKIFEDILHLRENNPIAIATVLFRQVFVLTFRNFKLLLSIKICYTNKMFGSKISICYLVDL